MCIKNVIMFKCGHTRLLSYKCEYNLEQCPYTRRLLISEEGVDVRSTTREDQWTCIFKCQPDVPAHDPLIDLAKENINGVKADIAQRIEILCALATPSVTPGTGDDGFNLEEKFANSLARRQSGLMPAYEGPTLDFESRPTSSLAGISEKAMKSVQFHKELASQVSNLKLRIPAARFRQAITDGK